MELVKYVKTVETVESARSSVRPTSARIRGVRREEVDGHDRRAGVRDAAGQIGAAGVRRRRCIERGANEVELLDEVLELGDARRDVGLLVVDELAHALVRRTAVRAGPDGEQLGNLVAAQAHLARPRDEQ